MKPKWTPTGSFLYAQSGLPFATETASEWRDIRLVVGEGRDVVESVLKGADKDVSLKFSNFNYCPFPNPGRSLKVILKWQTITLLLPQVLMSVSES
jgi:hypothetical protein